MLCLSLASLMSASEPFPPLPDETELPRWAYPRRPRAPLPDRRPVAFIRLGTGVFSTLSGTDGVSDLSLGVSPMGRSGLWLSAVFSPSYGPQSLSLSGGLRIGAQVRTRWKNERVQPYVGFFTDVLGGVRTIPGLAGSGMPTLSSSGGFSTSFSFGKFELRLNAGVGFTRMWQSYEVERCSSDDWDTDCSTDVETSPLQRLGFVGTVAVGRSF